MAARKKYSKEFKLDAVSLVIDQGYTPTEAGRGLGINANIPNRIVVVKATKDKPEAIVGFLGSVGGMLQSVQTRFEAEDFFADPDSAGFHGGANIRGTKDDGVSVGAYAF